MENTEKTKGSPCPGCGRHRRTCWQMPCLYLQQVVEQGMGAIEKWARAGGGVLVARKQAS
jgi:hypothetical protein